MLDLLWWGRKKLSPTSGKSLNVAAHVIKVVKCIVIVPDPVDELCPPNAPVDAAPTTWPLHQHTHTKRAVLLRPWDGFHSMRMLILRCSSSAGLSDTVASALSKGWRLRPPHRSSKRSQLPSSWSCRPTYSNQLNIFKSSKMLRFGPAPCILKRISFGSFISSSQAVDAVALSFFAISIIAATFFSPYRAARVSKSVVWLVQAIKL